MTRRSLFYFALPAALMLAVAVFPQNITTEEHAPSISLSLAVIMVKAKPGQSFSQDLTIYNNTISELTFNLEAMDIVVRDGKRTFVPAGEIDGSIASNAVFSRPKVVVLPASSATTTVTVTLPPIPGPRAIACVFTGKTAMGSKNSLSITGSLGALVTFSIAEDFHVTSQPIQVAVDQSSPSITFSQSLTNVGSDPVVPTGTIAVLNQNGTLVARLPMPAQRLLPGETQEIKAEYPGALKTGKYRVTFLMENQSAFFSNAAEFTIK